MQIVKHPIQLKSEELTLTNQRAIYWQRERALILSDVHIGKTAHFRKYGIPMPKTILEQDLERLMGLIEHFNAKKLLIVGDLFHAGSNTDLTVFEEWKAKSKDLKVVLIKGNHDRISKSVIERFQLELHAPELVIEPFTFIHDKGENSSSFQISGHTHPGVTIEGKGKQRIKLPCYQITESELILPAFSLFTGLNTKNAPEDCDCYAFTETGIFKV
ncbi:ligase-associated DNA damage response endonuclease PdeM [Winogradskyella maritima]|uniref:Ligase-associated DNA damage response endonuclease PdeM n=1 Tax=Winogradskyella maritima TaxID=1517766 RepID=A0ABV8AHU6_9FLAO|nr:ligase-associated DNA damage response endonuclease PdeM [Winogradskyella maritima]